MKKIFLTIGLAALVSSSQAQGLLNFVNSAATVITLSSNSVNLGSAPAFASGGSFRYELYRAAAGTATDVGFVATGVIATNTTAGRFVAGNGIAVPGTALGGTAALIIRGWSSNLGSTWAEAKANEGIIGGYFGSSAIAPNFLMGGDGGSGFIQPAPVFGGSNGIVPQSGANGFTLTWVPVVPEPSSMALAGLGAAALMIFRRRK